MPQPPGRTPHGATRRTSGPTHPPGAVAASRRRGPAFHAGRLRASGTTMRGAGGRASGPTSREEGRLAAVERDIFSRRPEHAIVPTLDRIAALASLLGDPQRACPVIHVTGTNGKTSTARMAESLLRARGLRTGLYTSPHLSSLRERICIDGEPLSP